MHRFCFFLLILERKSKTYLSMTYWRTKTKQSSLNILLQHDMTFFTKNFVLFITVLWVRLPSCLASTSTALSNTSHMERSRAFMSQNWVMTHTPFVWRGRHKSTRPNVGLSFSPSHSIIHCWNDEKADRPITRTLFSLDALWADRFSSLLLEFLKLRWWIGHWNRRWRKLCYAVVVVQYW